MWSERRGQMHYFFARLRTKQRARAANCASQAPFSSWPSATFWRKHAPYADTSFGHVASILAKTEPSRGVAAAHVAVISNPAVFLSETAAVLAVTDRLRVSVTRTSSRCDPLATKRRFRRGPRDHVACRCCARCPAAAMHVAMAMAGCTHPSHEDAGGKRR